MTRTGSYFPGDVTPGRRQPGMASPGSRAPGERVEDSATVTIDVTADGVHDIGPIAADRVDVDEVVVDGEAYGFDFQVEVGGTELFDAPQSPDSTDPQAFDPDTDVVLVTEDRYVNATVEVVDPSDSDDAEAEFTLTALVEDE